MTSLCKLEDFASTFAPYIEDLHDFFRSRGVRFGSAEDVAAVVERVAGDDAFHDEMASMVRAIIYRERDGLAPIELFELMVVAIGGARMEEAGEEISGSAAQLLAFVRGVFHSRWKADVDTPGGLEATGETVDRSSVESAELEEPGRGPERAETTAAGEMRAETGESEFATASAGPDPNARVETAAIRETHPSSALFYRARVVAAARHEPAWPVEAEVPVERVATRVEAQQGEVWTPVEPIAIGDEAATMAARQRTFVTWLTVNWQTITWPSVRWPTVGWPSLRWPTLSWVRRAVSGSRGWMWAVGLCALGVAVGAGLWPHESGGVATPVRRVERSSAALAAGQKPSPGVKSLRDEEVVAMISAAEQRGRNSVAADDLDLAGGAEEPMAQDQLREGRSRGVRSHAMRQERTGSAVTSELKVQPAQAEAAPVAVASVPRAAAPKESFADSAPSAAAAGYGVSPALMGSRLLYAPKLEYPMLAKLAHVQGKVVVEAVVGRDGWVTAAKVLSGHRLLRGAALSVVRGLHYRPYTMNDRPMEVATIVTVNFRLHR